MTCRNLREEAELHLNNSYGRSTQTNIHNAGQNVGFLHTHTQMSRWPSECGFLSLLQEEPPGTGKCRPESCVCVCAGSNPFWKFLQCPGSGVSVITQHNTSVITTVTDCTADRLIDSFHAQTLNQRFPRTFTSNMRHVFVQVGHLLLQLW